MNSDVVVYERKPLSAAEIQTQVNTIQSVMKQVMKEGEHYGTIPGCKKPSLYKPGSEKILSTFHIAVIPGTEDVVDLSGDDFFRFRVHVRGATLLGEIIGIGIGECSTDEEKYKWRASVCKEEFESTQEDRRRLLWKKADKYHDKPYQVMQVRTNPADLANTVLKMAKKRGQIDLTLTATAASDIFTQDIEDVSEELRDNITEGQQKEAMKPPESKSAASPDAPGGTEPPKDMPTGDVISEAQAKRFYAIAKGSNWSDEDIHKFLTDFYQIDSSRKILKAQYDEIIDIVKVKKDA